MHITEDAIEIEVFKHLFASIAEEMGARLMRSAYSPNIKERLDFSCALFDGLGHMVAQAAHIPVHLGATPLSVQAILRHFPAERMRQGEFFVVNDPFDGGTHLPDITVVAPCFLPEERLPRFFVANRAHHADVGGISPGSMPISTSIDDEGLRIPPSLLDAGAIERIASAGRTPDERRGDLNAQTAALRLGVSRLQALAAKYGADVVANRAAGLQTYTERLMRSVISAIPDGTYAFGDILDDDGHGTFDIPIHATVSISGSQATVDLRASADQVRGPVNAVRAIAESAVNYVFRCLADAELPVNAGVMRPITVLTRPGSVVDALPPAAVEGGNVETSQRLVDVLFGALAQALPDRIPAASCGSMNNLTIGGTDPRSGRAFAYYETLAGGAGATARSPGIAAVHTHMTNTRNTPIEALEHAYPFRIDTYRIRTGSGGLGRRNGGDGVVRRYLFECPAEVTLLTERRRSRPYGLSGGHPGQTGRNILSSDNADTELPGKQTLHVQPGDRLQIETPGGGAWGEESMPP